MKAVVLIMLCFFATSVSAATPAVTIDAEDDAAPWSMPDGSGYVNDIIRSSYSAVGWKVSLRIVPYARCKQEVLDGIVAGCFTVGKSQEVMRQMLFSEEPHLYPHMILFTTETSSFKGCAPEQWPKTPVVAAVNSYEYPPRYDAMKLQRKITVQITNSEIFSIQMLALGRVDAAVLSIDPDTKPLEYIAWRAKVGKKVIPACDLGEIPSFIAFSKTHPDGTKALAAFNAGYRIIRSDGTLAQLKSKWQVYAHQRTMKPSE